MLVDIAYTVGGFVLLIWGADRFVIGAAGMAELLGVPPVIIGITIVGFGTSAPEIMVSAAAATEGLTSLAVGNAIGSNIANVGLVLGATAIAHPISVHLTGTLRREIVLLIWITALSALLFVDNALSRLDASLLLIGFVMFMAWIIRRGLQARTLGETGVAPEPDLPGKPSAMRSVLWLLAGLAILLLGAELLVEGAERLAVRAGVSELIIGLTILAIGTSLPELAVSFTSALRGSTGIAIGNIIGSNIFNLLAVVGIAGMIQPAPLDLSVLQLHYPVMFLYTLALLRIAYNPFGRPGFSRPVGIILLTGFVVYQGVLWTG